MKSERYDLAVIGSGPAGQKAAIAAAKLGKSVALVDKAAMLGGVSLHKGTIPSKTLRESVLHLTGLRHRAFFDRGYLAKPNIRAEDLMQRVDLVIQEGRAVVRDQLNRNQVHLVDGLASTAMEQGRLASCHMFGAPFNNVPELLPFGIYSIPEISFVGRTEHQLTESKIPYEVGLALFEEVARAQIVGDRVGLLKLLFDPESLEILGVHVIGESAAELVHIGLTVMVAGGTVETLRDTVFNYPTMAEVYKVAAIDGLNKVRRSPAKPESRSN